MPNDDTPLLGSASKPGSLAPLDKESMKSFSICLGVSQILVLAAFKIVCNMSTDLNNVQYYNLLLGIEIMMFVGFGYLMTFLRWYGLGAAGLTLLITCYGMELALLFEPLFQNWWEKQIQIDLIALMNANFAVAALLISFGALIGKINPLQLWLLITIETAVYCFNKRVILSKWLNIMDYGGTIIIHEFGAYFGLACAYMIGKPKDASKEKSSTVSDVFSIIGTAFLWIYWPSFVSGTLPIGSISAQRAIVNTILSLLGATVTAFALSPLVNEMRLSPVHAQNATLAGGVSIGVTANLNLGPFGALLIGSGAGFLCTIGYAYVQPLLEAMIGLHDTCGVGNLHGMSSIFGALVSALLPIWISDAGAPKTQLAGLAMTLAVAIPSGALTGKLMTFLKDEEEVPLADDSSYWEVADDFEANTSQ
uniref:Ammonium transporter AmtB-like domain-containing protein n=1 Tax=Aureoumbra lagunensis TaxID=44058 RepID=A0A7S3NKZ6_9STRA|mmetsp:Transcript_6051/g.8930  ORF Transcript_6051/g.8930 Transcript_6051/m.8930 type:complete len:422 (+) Transcript_6051:44-1309(+)